MIRIEAHKSDVRAVAVSQMYIYSAGRDCKVIIILQGSRNDFSSIQVLMVAPHLC